MYKDINNNIENFKNQRSFSTLKLSPIYINWGSAINQSSFQLKEAVGLKLRALRSFMVEKKNALLIAFGSWFP